MKTKKRGSVIKVIVLDAINLELKHFLTAPQEPSFPKTSEMSDHFRFTDSDSASGANGSLIIINKTSAASRLQLNIPAKRLTVIAFQRSTLN